MRLINGFVLVLTLSMMTVWSQSPKAKSVVQSIRNVEEEPDINTIPGI